VSISARCCHGLESVLSWGRCWCWSALHYPVATIVLDGRSEIVFWMNAGPESLDARGLDALQTVALPVGGVVCDPQCCICCKRAGKSIPCFASASCIIEDVNAAPDGVHVDTFPFQVRINCNIVVAPSRFVIFGKVSVIIPTPHPLSVMVDVMNISHWRSIEGKFVLVRALAVVI